MIIQLYPDRPVRLAGIGEIPAWTTKRESHGYDFTTEEKETLEDSSSSAD